MLLYLAFFCNLSFFRSFFVLRFYFDFFFCFFQIKAFFSIGVFLAFLAFLLRFLSYTDALFDVLSSFLGQKYFEQKTPSLLLLDGERGEPGGWGA